MYQKIDKAEALGDAKYEISIQEVGRPSADVFIMSAEEHQTFAEAYARDEYFQIEVDGRVCMYNIPMLSSIKVKKLDSEES